MALPLRETEFADQNPAITPNPSELKSPDLKIVPLQPSDQKPDSQYLADLAADEVEVVLKHAAERLSDAAEPIHEFGERLVRSYDNVAQEAARVVRSQIKRLRHFAEDDPVRFLGMVAAGAFAAGIALRLLTRSRDV
jgi:hypothetical protein